MRRDCLFVFEITEGQRHDSRAADELLKRAKSSCLLVDKAYDSDAFRAALAERSCLRVSLQRKPSSEGSA